MSIRQSKKFLESGAPEPEGDSAIPAAAGRRFSMRAAVALAVVLSVVSAAGAVGASHAFRVRGDQSAKAELNCRGGMTQLSHVLAENASIFPGDPETTIDIAVTYSDFGGEGFLLEEVGFGTHTGTHLDAPAHFIEGERSVDQIDATEFVWPAYVIDVRDRIAATTGTPDEGFQLTMDDIRDYERSNGKIRKGSIVIIQTGWEEKFGQTGDETPESDDYVADVAPGFSAEAVQWMFDVRKIKAIGSDTLGPDSYLDEGFGATFTALANDGFAVPGLNNLDSLNTRGDIIIAAPVRLIDGSGFQVNPLACHRK